MKLEEASLRSIVDERLGWEDFGGREQAIKALKESFGDEGTADAMAPEQAEALDKVAYLDEQEAGDVIEPRGHHRLDFYSLELTSFARLGLANGDPEGTDTLGAVGYDHSYDNMHILVEVMMGVCAVYIKDYSFGYIKPFGDCVYDFCGGAGLMKIDPEEFLEELIIPKLELDILEGKIDLAKELYDYYHRIPAGNNPYTKFHIDESDFMSVQDAAKALDITEGRVKKLISERTLDGYKIGDDRALWLSREQVRARIDYIAKHGKPTRGKARK